MRKLHIFFVLTATLVAQPIFAHGYMHSRSCAAIAKACMKAGYSEHGSMNKNIWFGCMKPIILGKSMSGVMVSASQVKACRMDKINEIKRELKEFENAS